MYKVHKVPKEKKRQKEKKHDTKAFHKKHYTKSVLRKALPKVKSRNWRICWANQKLLWVSLGYLSQNMHLIYQDIINLFIK